MKTRYMIGILWAMALLYGSCQKDLMEFSSEDIRVRIKTGEEWKHPFPVLLGIKKQNPPQIAIWVEDTVGNYLSTIYVSHKIATQSWQGAGGNRRKESLPHWCHKRGVQYEDGLFLPTKKNPLPDGITGATPTGSFDVKLRPMGGLSRFVVKAEFNHSIDFNDNFPKFAKEGDWNYTGGKKGSGQPAVVYEVFVDLDSGKDEFRGNLIGYSSPDGSDGELNAELTLLTSAVQIVKEITIKMQ